MFKLKTMHRQGTVKWTCPCNDCIVSLFHWLHEFGCMCFLKAFMLTHSLELERSGHWPHRPSSAWHLCRCLRGELLCLLPRSRSVLEELCLPVKEVNRVCNYTSPFYGLKPLWEGCKNPLYCWFLTPKILYIFFNECEERKYYECDCHNVKMSTDHIEGGGRWRSWGRGRRGRNRHLDPLLAMF